MNKKGSNFFEEHVEKIVLAIAVIVSLWLFIDGVLFSSVYIEYDGDKFAPGAIDNHISKQVAALEDRINRKPEPKQPYNPRTDDFLAIFDSAIGNIDTSLVLPQPIISPIGTSDDRVYRIPQIGEIKEVLAEHIRAVAYVPNREIGEGTVYAMDSSGPNDIDFVTVEAKFDVAELYKRFNESFAGENVQNDWRDPRLAKPVFAAVQLQRQELITNGSCSNWQTVPRSRVDYNRRMFKIIENVDDLPAGGLKVRLLQFDNPSVTIDLLQPEAYFIASAKEEWFPPSLHGAYLEYQKGVDIMKRREAAAGKKDERETERSDKRSRTTRTESRPTTGTDSEFAFYNAMMAGKRTSAKKSPTTREVERERPQKAKEVSKTIDDIYQELDGILITENTDLDKMNKPLSFWAFDDTVEPGKSYQYRIRLGVFNPIADTNQFAEQSKALKNKVILWSEFSDTTAVVDIPEILYFFPLEIQEAAGVVTMQVSKYVLGYWYSRDFMIKAGELIGKLSEYKITEDEEKKGVMVPKTVDYDTGAVLVDILPVTDWSGGSNLSIRRFFEALYSFDGKDIERLPVKTRYWPDALQSKFNEIKRLEKEPKEPLKVWDTARARRRAPTQLGEEEIPPDMRMRMKMMREGL
ncbi:MAG: hypothetical protein JW947_03755 [Sedimentisphaerales bacterium]|nr:hypothetical protein [Sedimentisphaerales bacterium]